MDHYKLVADNYLKNVEEVRKTTGSDLIDFRMMTQCYGMDMIAKIIFAIDIDSFKQRDSEFVTNARTLGEVHLIQFVRKHFANCLTFVEYVLNRKCES